MRMYLNNNGANWSVNTGWSGSGDHCSWQGVTCNADKEVAQLSLIANQLSGTFPSDLNSLGSMQLLNVNSNNMAGTVPADLCERSLLTDLHIHADSDNCPHGFDAVTGVYLEGCCDDLTIDVDVYLSEFAQAILGDATCANLAGVESSVCDYMSNKANHDIFASGYPTDFAGDVWSWLKVRYTKDTLD